MSQHPMDERQARDLFVRQLKDLSRQGAAPDSQARLRDIFARSEAACREQEQRLASEAAHLPVPDRPVA